MSERDTESGINSSGQTGKELGAAKRTQIPTDRLELFIYDISVATQANNL